MNGNARFGDESGLAWRNFCGAPFGAGRGGKPMTIGMVAIGIAAAGAWLICYLPIEHVKNRRIARGLSHDHSGPPGGIAGGDGWSPLGFGPLSWSGSDNSPSFDSSGNPGYSGGCDSGGDSDGGGSGGDGGGGD
jgi:hypothetical protein